MMTWLKIKQLKLARYLLNKVLSDHDFRVGYYSNISMTIYDTRDKHGRHNIHTCNVAAEKILKYVFGC